MEENKFIYTLKRSKRARKISIIVHHNGEVIVTLPMRASELLARAFVHAKRKWIETTQERLQKRFSNKTVLHQSSKDFKEHKKQALEFFKNRVERFNRFYKFKVGKIHVRNQKSRWGSCAANGNLSFNYGLIKVPQELADYVVVHELCHLQEFNHSKHFWALVSQTIPDYKQKRNLLKKNYISIT